MQNRADKGGDGIEVSDPSRIPGDLKNWVGIAFRQSDTEFLEMFNKTMKNYRGSDAMRAAVGEYGYTKSNIPGDNANTEWVCQNR